MQWGLSGERMIKEKIIQIQGNKLCKCLGYPPGTKIDINIIKSIANGNVGDVVPGTSIAISMSMKGIACILVKKICS